VLNAGGSESYTVLNILFQAVEINLLLAFFNLVPVPPLDGGNVLAGLLPESAAGLLDGLRQYGFILLYALLLTGILRAIIEPPTIFFMELLLR
jgi:Zn-dependent protease